jgi:hypothetical protein
MFATIPEKYMRLTRWSLTIGWLILIASLFYDPVSAALTQPGSPFAAATDCFQFQGQCRPLTPYPMGARLFWGMVLPLVILTLLILGHEAWRRICPLSFLSQIARAMGWQKKRVISEESWLGRNALYFQFCLLFLGLNVRLLLVNSDRLLLGVFLVLTLVSAIAIGFLYDGKTWCNYFCPMAPVHIIYSEPTGLLSSAAHKSPPKTITQSTCRTIDRNGQEKSACVACTIGCMDVDAEGSYWESIKRPERKLLYYAYIGLVIGFYLYFGLYSGNWRFLSAGVWNETNQLATLLSPGFYIAGQAIAIPKLIAVPLTLTVCSGMTYAIGLWLEKQVKRHNRKQQLPLYSEQLQSRLFAISTFLSFNLLFFMGVRPTLGYLPIWMQQGLSWVAIVASSLWLVKNWRRSLQRYQRERDAHLLRQQLGKLDVDFSEWLEGRTLQQLKPDELYALAKVLPRFSQEHRLQIYIGTLRDALTQKQVSPKQSLKVFASLRQKLEISEERHWEILETLHQEEPDLTNWTRSSNWETEATLYRRPNPSASQAETTVYKPMGDRSKNPPRATADQKPPQHSSDESTVWRDPKQP